MRGYQSRGLADNMDYMDLFQTIFGDSQGYLCLAVIEDIRNPDKSRQGFHQHFFTWPEQASEIRDWVEEHKGGNCYFCPCLLSEPIRQKKYVLPGHTLWADLDDCQPQYLGKYGEPTPSVLVRSSPNHWQSYWFLELDLPPDEYEKLNRRIALAYKDEGCDKGGWDLT